MAEVQAQERLRKDDVLYGFSIVSQNVPLETKYNLIHQKFLIEDDYSRRMSSGTMDSRFKEKVSCGVWKGERKVDQYETIDSKGRTRKHKEILTDGLAIFPSSKGLIKIPNWNDHKTDRELTDLTKIARCFDFSPNEILNTKATQENGLPPKQLELLMGTDDGVIYLFDPELVNDAKVDLFNYSKSTMTKQKKVEHIKWFEEYPNQNQTDSNINKKFLVVFEDGTIYSFYKDFPDGEEKGLSKQKESINLDKEGDKSQTKEQIVMWMQQAVEDTDFSEFYTKNGGDGMQKPLKFPVMQDTQKYQQLFHTCENQHDGCIQVVKHIDEHRALNFVSSFFIRGNNTEMVNPGMILRFDVRQINDIVTYRSGDLQREHNIVVACNDGYVRVYNATAQSVVKAIKGLSGNPLCIALADRAVDSTTGQKEMRDVMTVGYEDDSFIVYSILQDFKPLFRGLGHRSFISEIAFDNTYIQKQIELLAHSNKDLLMQQNLQKKDSIMSEESESLAQLLKRQKSIQMNKVDPNKREYRILTGGEDGQIAWWNCLVSKPNGFQKLSKASRIVVVDEQIEQIRPAHQIFLSQNAAMHCLIHGQKSFICCQNDLIMTFYKVSYKDPSAPEIEEESKSNKKE